MLKKKNVKKLTSLLICLSVLFTSLAWFPAHAIAEGIVSFEEKIIFENEVFSESEYETMAAAGEELPESVSVTLRFDESFSCTHENIESDEELMEHRNELKAHYKNLNEKLIASIGLTDYANMSYSWYGPFIEYQYATYDDFTENDYDTLAAINPTAMTHVYIGSDYGVEDCASIGSDNRAEYPFSQALSDVGIPTNKPYDGTNVKIGVIESGVPNNLINLPYITASNRNEYIYGTNTTDHAFWTSSIMGGTSGIANGATLYFAELKSSVLSDNEKPYSFYDSCNWLLGKGVNIINMSANTGSFGIYDSYAAYIDYIVDTTYITFIKSAGNARDDTNANTHNYISSPGTAINAICVASNDVDLKISNFSSYAMTTYWENTNQFLKPTLTAPGGRLTGIQNITQTISGTSFSAPIVTGIVAMLMEEFSELIYSPEAVMALLTSTCTLATGQTWEYDQDAGFGIVNYSNARAAYENCTYFNVFGTFDTMDMMRVKNIYVAGQSNALVTIGTLYHSNCNTPSNTNIAVPECLPIYMEIYDLSGDLVSVGTTVGNITYAVIFNSGNASTYQIKLYWGHDEQTYIEIESGYICYYYTDIE